MRSDDKTNPQTITELNLSKLSVVPKPAHEGAQAKIIKEAAITPEQVEKQSFMETLQQHQVNEASQQLMDNTWDMTYALRKSIRKTIEDSTIQNKKDVIQGNISDFASTMGNMFSTTNVIKSTEEEMTPEEIQKMVDDANKPLQEKLVLAESIAKMNDETKAHYYTLDDEGKAAFLKMTDAEKVIKMTPAPDDESFTANGQTILKSEVGAGVFAMFKAQQKELEVQKTTTKAAQEKTELMEFTKQAEGVIPNLPGEPIAKGNVMMAISKMASDVKETLTAMLKAGNEAFTAAKTLDEFGVGGEIPLNGTSPVAKLNKMAEDKAVEENIPFAKAYDAVLQTKEGGALYGQM